MKKIISFSLMIAIVAAGCATKYHRANYDYNNMAYYKASEKYRSYLGRHDKPEAMLRLAATYSKMHEYDKAEYWYGRGVSTSKAGPADYLAYADVLKTNGKYAEAKQWYARYLEAKPNDAMARARMEGCDRVGEYSSNEEGYVATAISTGQHSFGMTKYGEGYVFCSEQPLTPDVKVNPWNGRSYLRIMYSRFYGDGSHTTPVPFNSDINNYYHNGPVAFTSDYNKIYFSRSNCMDNKRFRSLDKVNNIKIYTADRDGNDWVNIRELPFNSNDYSCGHPALSADGQAMYFVSDKPGGHGNTDIYMSVYKNGKWSKPQNLGDNINTAGYEMFPAYYRDGKGQAYLYFSSDGHAGMGGLDLYYSAQQADGSWGKPVHMNAPFNSSADDFSLVYDGNGSTGYFSSSREGNMDKLFMFNKQPKLFADGAVYDKETKVVITDAKVIMNNKATGKSEAVVLNSDGMFHIPLQANIDYTFNATHDNFLPGSTNVSTVGKNRSETIPVQIIVDSVCHVLSMSKIHYDFDKWNIRPDAARQLDTLVAFLNKHVDIKVELSSHADSRGTQEYNIELTQKRARSVVDYLTAKGVDPQRLLARWHGKLVPVNECIDGVVCAPAKHEQNRRTEIIVVNGSCDQVIEDIKSGK